MNDEKRLLEFICPKCQKSIVWAEENAKVRCRFCKKWIGKEEVIEKHFCLEEASGDMQLELFE